MDTEKNSPETFEQALEGAQALMSAQEQEQAAQAAQAQAEQAQAAQAEQAQAAQAAQAAQEQAAQASRQPDPMEVIASMQQQMSGLSAENQRLKQLISEQSAAAEGNTVREALTPPELDLNDLWSADENVLHQRQREYGERMVEFVKGQIMGELEPYLEDARRGQAERAEQTALEGLSQVPQLRGIMGMTPTLRKIIETNPALANSNAPIEDKLITAFAIAKGADAINNPPAEPTRESWMAMYENDPELRKQVEIRRAQRTVAAQAQTPPMTAGAGAASAPLAPPARTPQDFDEAKRSMMARLGL